MATNSGYYEQARRSIDEDFGAQGAANAYSRTLAQMRGSRDLNRASEGFSRGMPSFSSQFASRGFTPGVNSGVMQQQMTNYLNDFNTQYMDAQQELGSQMQGFDLRDAQLAASRNSSLADLELQKARDISSAAQNIEMLRALLGGA